jgi:hypothetical protein
MMGSVVRPPALRWPRGRSAVGVTVAVAVISLASCSSASTSSTPSTTSDPTTRSGSSAVSRADAPAPVWLCRPGQAADPCTANLDATVFHANGTTTTQPGSPAKDPPIDCFYVYPTVSAQKTVNANLTVDPEETAVAIAQASRFSTACRIYAPVYPQLTLASITGGATAPLTAAAATAYNGVLSAWQYYLAHYNHGRGVVFLGHSQGSGMLIQLLRSQVDPNPTLRQHLVSALLLGGNVTVPVGKTVGGDFRHIPACTSNHQTGCVVAYSMFLDPPPADSGFGRVGQGVSSLSGVAAAPGQQVLCTNPVSLDHPSVAGVLQPYAPTAAFPGPLGLAYRPVPSAPTPWASYPNLYTGRCESSGGATWLQVDRIQTPGDTRPSVSQTLGPTWGLHIDDVNLAMGNLVSLVHDQAAAYTR